MKYNSTRGSVRGLRFQDSLFTGYADDGGILLPDKIPEIDKDTLKSWRTLSYVDIVKRVVSLFIEEDEIPKQDLEGLIDKAFSRFTHPDVTPITRLQNGLNVMELFHGVTWAFKDLALSCVGQFLEYFLSKSQRHLTIIVGTSGDTGSAAIEAVRGLKWVDIVVLLPGGRCSKIQELQMTTVKEDNVHVFRVDGSSDDLDIPIKDVFMDIEFKRRHNLSSINSINWARIMVQTAHYIFAYLQMCPSCDGELEIVIPTGALGNATAGCIARKMGVPVKLVCAVTVNDIVARTLRDGDFSKAENVQQTLASAMDIQIPYNIERIWTIVSDYDVELVKGLMTRVEETGKVQVPEELLQKMKKVFVDSFVASDDTVRKTMRETWEEHQYPICPHTAIGVAYHYHKLRENKGVQDTPRVIIATASVKKFQEASESAGLQPFSDEKVTQLLSMETHYTEMNKGDNWEKMLRKKIEDISNNRVH